MANKIVFAIELVGNASGVVSAVATAKKALSEYGSKAKNVATNIRGLANAGGLGTKSVQTSNQLKALAGLRGGKDQFTVDYAGLQDDRMAKRYQGILDSDERLKVAQQKLKDASADVAAKTAKASSLTTGTKAHDEALKDIETAKKAEATAKRYVYNAEVNYARRVYEYRLALERKEIDERKKLFNMEAQIEKNLGSAKTERKEAGLSTRGSEGVDTAKKTLDTVNGMEPELTKVSDSMRKILPAGMADAMDEMLARQKQGMAQSLQLAIQDAEKKKQVAVGRYQGSCQGGAGFGCQGSSPGCQAEKQEGAAGCHRGSGGVRGSKALCPGSSGSVDGGRYPGL